MTWACLILPLLDHDLRNKTGLHDLRKVAASLSINIAILHVDNIIAKASRSVVMGRLPCLV